MAQKDLFNVFNLNLNKKLILQLRKNFKLLRPCYQHKIFRRVIISLPMETLSKDFGNDN